MSVETVVGTIALAALGLMLVGVGSAGRRRRITFALGGWTADQATPESRAREHRTIGIGCLALLVPVVVGVVVGVVGGLHRLEPRDLWR